MSVSSQFAATRISLPGTPLQHFAPWSPPVYGASVEKLYTVVQSDIGRPDAIAERVWERSDLWWVIMHYNGVADAFNLQPGDRLLIPSLSVVEDALLQMQTRGPAIGSDMDDTDVPLLPLQVPSPVQPLTLLLPAPLDERVPVTMSGVIAFTVSAAEAAHYQLQISLDPAFDTVYLSRTTMISASGWEYLNSAVWTAFPSGAGGLTTGQTQVRLTVADLGLPRAYVRWRAWLAELDQPWQII